MSPSIVTLANIPDFDDDFAPSKPTTAAASSTTTAAPAPAADTNGTGRRTLLLAPPALASNEPALAALLTAHPRTTTDLQMLDRLSANLVQLPSSTYDLVLVLSSPATTTTTTTTTTSSSRSTISDSTALLDRDVLSRVADSLLPGGKLRAEAGARLDGDAGVVREAILAGLVVGEGDEVGGFAKPDYGDGGETVTLLKFGKKKQDKSSAGPAVGAAVVKLDGRDTTVKLAPGPAGVGFVNGMDLDDDDDDDLIDEDTLLTEEDLKRPLNIPPECAPKVGKRRRACKDCSCGLKEKLEQEDAVQRAEADNKLKAVGMSVDEIDFTVPGKVGSCGNCTLGDAFRCDGCPYRGLPKFNWGEEVKLLNEVQL